MYLFTVETIKIPKGRKDAGHIKYRYILYKVGNYGRMQQGETSKEYEYPSLANAAGMERCDELNGNIEDYREQVRLEWKQYAELRKQTKNPNPQD